MCHGKVSGMPHVRQEVVQPSLLQDSLYKAEKCRRSGVHSAKA